MHLWLLLFLIALFPSGFFFLFAYLLRQRALRPGGALLPLTVGTALNGLWASGLLVSSVDQGVHPPLLFWWRWAAGYGLLLASGAICLATLAFLRRRRVSPARRWLSLLLAGLGVTLLLDPNLLSLPLPELHLAGRVIPSGGWWEIAWVLVWGLSVAIPLWFIVKSHPGKAGALHRNRTRYWVLAVSVNWLGDVLILTGQPLATQAAAPIKLLAAVVASLSLLSLRLPDLRRVTRRASSVLAVALAAWGLFFLAIWAGWTFQSQFPQLDLLPWAMAGLAIVLTILYYPIRRLVEKLVEGAVFPDFFDLDAVLRHYGEHVSQVLEVERLAETLVGVVDEALHVEHGTLVLATAGTSGEMVLKPVLTRGRPLLPVLTCSAGSPLIQRLHASAEPLTQYDVDVLPDYTGLSGLERETLALWQAELYVPIRCRGQVAGLLALGAKRSGDPYFDAELVLLTTLARQTAIPLEKARLFADLKALNRQISRLNQELEQTNLQLRELDRLKSSFIDTISDELFRPLVPIDLALQSIEKQGLEHMGREQREQFEYLSQSLDELRRMADQLVSMTSLVSRQTVLTLDEVDLAQIVQETVQSLEMMSTARRVTVQVGGLESLTPINGDRQRLADVVHHLLHNAIKFNRSDGAVNVRCRRQGDSLVVEIQDTGRGIPRERLGALGSPFMRLADPTAGGGEGIGLGLALVKYIVQAHGGELQVQSQLGVGSTFSLYLPAGCQRPPSSRGS